ncbi:hypothetical protein AC1031_020461 [Aphanomyces cochlioides]|nr:hypothetical protein AC1031_020461 [Aphanomyces cochlioides]
MKPALVTFLTYAVALALVPPPPCTDKQVGDVVAVLTASPNLPGCKRDSGFNWVALFNTTDGLPIDEQVQASTTSNDCAALNADVGKLNVSSCSVWNVDLAALVKQGLQKWHSAKQTYIFMEVPKECTAGQVAAFVASVKASRNLESCSKAVGFDWLTFFTTDVLPMYTKVTESMSSTECAAFFADIHELQVDSCMLWANRLPQLVAHKPQYWVDSKSYFLRWTNNSTKSNATTTTPSTTAAPTSSVASTTTLAPITTMAKSSASTLAAQVLAAALALAIFIV